MPIPITIPSGDADNGNESDSDSSLIVPQVSRTHPGQQVAVTDNLSGSRRSSAVIRSKNEVIAMSRRARGKVQMRNFFHSFRKIPATMKDISHHGSVASFKGSLKGSMKDALDLDDLDGLDGEPRAPQYRLQAAGAKQRGWFCFRGAGDAKELSDIKPNERLASLLHWMFRASFVVLFCVMCFTFFAFVTIFAGFVIAAARLNSDCVRAGGETVTGFSDAFALSWTTFSTVGYGSTYPALSHENDSENHCMFITFVCSLEAFFGVLYSGFCGAILFGKVLRIQSHAQVIFSDAIVIRYGSGLQEPNEDGESNGVDGGEEKRIPCPVLEFRIVNSMFNETGGEIMDASLNVVANVNARDADPILVNELRSSKQASRRSKHLRSYTYVNPNAGGVGAEGKDPMHRRFLSVDDRTMHRRLPSVDDRSSTTMHRRLPSGMESIFSDTMSDDSCGASLDSKRSRRSMSLFNSFMGSRNQRIIDEDPSARFLKKRIFSKMYFEQGGHPFFKRVWVGRHILNEESPLVRPRVKRRIRKNQGYWPSDLNHYSEVRASLMFNQILVSLNGVSNLSANEVYANKIYDFVDVTVGYEFVNTLYKDTDGTLKVDTDLINDVREQRGGGGEPLILDDE